MPAFERILYAHRGASGALPENTLPAFVRGLELGATALETDVHMTSDGKVVVSHDPSGERLAGVRRSIREATLSEVQRWDVGWGVVSADGARPHAGRGYRIPTLEELLIEVPRVWINIDIKQRQPDMSAALVRVLRGARAVERVCLTSFDSDIVRAVRRAGFDGTTALGRRDVVRVFFSPRKLLERLPPPGTAIQLPPRAGPINFARRELIDKCHAVGLRVDYWTINDPVEASRLLELGADGIMSDHPDRIAPLFARARAPGAPGSTAGDRPSLDRRA